LEKLDMEIEKNLKHPFNSWILAGTYFRYPALAPARIPAHVPARILALFLLPKLLPECLPTFLTEFLPVYLSELLPMFLLICSYPFSCLVLARNACPLFFPARCNFFPDME